MISNKTRQEKMASLVITIFILSIVFIIQSSTIYAAPVKSLPVGVVNYQLLIQQHPDTVKAQETMEAVVKQVRSEFDTKSANMNDQEKQSYFQQLEQVLQQKHEELLNAIKNKVDAAVKAVADKRGLTIVVDKSATIYGGQDITDEVMKKIIGK